MSLLERLSDDGLSIERRELPAERIVLAAVAGAGGHVFTVEATPAATDLENALVVRRVLNPDLSDPAP